jgi:hypothetical protein
VPKGPKSGRASSKTREGLVIIKTSKASLNLKRSLWGDKPEGLLPENCPNFSFFFVWAGTLWALVTSPLRVLKEVRPDFGYFNYGPENLKFFREICFSRGQAQTKPVILIMDRETEVFSGKTIK